MTISLDMMPEAPLKNCIPPRVEYNGQMIPPKLLIVSWRTLKGELILVLSFGYILKSVLVLYG